MKVQTCCKSCQLTWNTFPPTFSLTTEDFLNTLLEGSPPLFLVFGSNTNCKGGLSTSSKSSSLPRLLDARRMASSVERESNVALICPNRASTESNGPFGSANSSAGEFSAMSPITFSSTNVCPGHMLLGS